MAVSGGYRYRLTLHLGDRENHCMHTHLGFIPSSNCLLMPLWIQVYLVNRLCKTLPTEGEENAQSASAPGIYVVITATGAFLGAGVCNLPVTLTSPFLSSRSSYSNERPWPTQTLSRVSR